MVDRISGNDNSLIQQSLLGDVQGARTEGVREAGKADEAKKTEAAATQHFDNAEISEEAVLKLAAEREVLKFGRLAQRMSEPYDADKVAHFKNMLDSGKINDYLRSLNTDDLVDSILNSPTRAFLR